MAFDQCHQRLVIDPETDRLFVVGLVPVMKRVRGEEVGIKSRRDAGYEFLLTAPLAFRVREFGDDVDVREYTGVEVYANNQELSGYLAHTETMAARNVPLEVMFRDMVEVTDPDDPGRILRHLANGLYVNGAYHRGLARNQGEDRFFAVGLKPVMERTQLRVQGERIYRPVSKDGDGAEFLMRAPLVFSVRTTNGGVCVTVLRRFRAYVTRSEMDSFVTRATALPARHIPLEVKFREVQYDAEQEEPGYTAIGLRLIVL